jgi:hypothetical protein
MTDPFVVRVQNAATGHQYNYPRVLAEIDDNLKIVDRPTHDAHGIEIPPLYAAEIPTAVTKAPGTRRGSATEAAASPEAEKEATES